MDDTTSDDDAGAAATVNVTATDAGELDAPVPAILTVPVYVPAARPAVATETAMLDGAVPERGEAFNQNALVVAVQLSVPPPVFATDTDCGAGAALPAVVEYDIAGLDKE